MNTELLMFIFGAVLGGVGGGAFVASVMFARSARIYRDHAEDWRCMEERIEAILRDLSAPGVDR